MIRAVAAALTLTAGSALAQPHPAHIACPGHPRCLSLSADGTTMTLPSITHGRAVAMPELPPLDLPDEGPRLDSLQMSLQDGRWLIGVLRDQRQMYSGGGGVAAHLDLILIVPGQPASVVLSLPYGSDILIRACFGEADHDLRNGLCHDNYVFVADLTAIPAAPDALPDLRYQATATALPPGNLRYDDGELRPVPPDVQPGIVDRCTFIRTFRFDATTGRYQPDEPLPDCTDFTQP